MSNRKVALIALGVWTLAVPISSRLALFEDNLLYLAAFLGLLLVPLAVAVNDTVLTYRRRHPTLPKPGHDLSEAKLRAVLGGDNVVQAWNLCIEPVGPLLEDLTKFGGHPTYRGPERWPRCKMCGEPMTFIGQVEVGPERPIRHPTQGVLYLFLCNSDPLVDPQCETWNAGKGGSACFVQPGPLEAWPLGEGASKRDLLSKAVARNRRNTPGGKSLFTGLDRHGKRSYRPYLARQYRIVEVHTQPSVRVNQIPDEHLELACAATAAFTVQIGGFPDWVQDPIQIRCRCGGEAELLMQFTAFDEVINLGDGGRAYVFGCRLRCAPDSFFLEWQCS